MKQFIIVSALIMFILTLFGCSGTPMQTKEMLLSPKVDYVNCALSSSGATAESPDNNPDHPPSAVIDGDTSSLNWDNGGGWEGSLSYLRSNEPLKRSYIQINLPDKRQIKKIVIYTIDSAKYPASEYGLRSYNLEYWHGTGWKMIDVAGERDKRFTVKNNISGEITHDVKGGAITDKVRLVPILSNDTKKDYDLTAFGGQPIYNISGSAKVMEIQVWCYPSTPQSIASSEKNGLLAVGKSLPSPDEQAIRNILSEYEQGYDNEDTKLVMSGFSDEFMTLDGKSRADIEKNATKFFEDYNSINLTFRDVRIEVAPSSDSAIATANYTLECVTQSDNNIHKRNDTLIFNFRKEDGIGWKIKSVK